VTALPVAPALPDHRHALLLGATAQDAVLDLVAEREPQAVGLDPAAVADGDRLFGLLDVGASLAEREEQLGVLVEAGTFAHPGQGTEIGRCGNESHLRETGEA
jgi:hypothetical protein